MQKPINIIVGRFQPFTEGHMKCIRKAYQETNNPTILCMINVKDEKVNEIKPFPSSLLFSLYNDVFKDNSKIEKVILVNSADIVKIGECLWEMGYEINSWTCGTDRYAAYLRQSTNYKMEAHLSTSFKLIEVERCDEDTSATSVRKAIKNNDIKAFNKLTGGIYNELIFETFKKYIS